MPTLEISMVLSSTEPVVTETVAVEIDGDRLAGPAAAVLDADAPVLVDGALPPGDEAGRRCAQAFAVVHHTLGLVRRADVLGRGAMWARGQPLGVRCVAPELGADARYSPDRHELALGVARDVAGVARYAADDPDVVAHETGHAVLHDLAPDLLSSWHPESLAIHEAVADLVTVLALLESDLFRERALGSIRAVAASDLLAGIAEGFAAASGRPALRSLRNAATLPGVGPAAGQVSTFEPHALSLVLSGAVWAFVVEGLTGYIEAESKVDLLAALARQLRRLLLRAFVYTPPGELTFGDVGRLLVGADRVVHGDSHGGQEARLDELFRERGMLGDDLPLHTPEVALPPMPPTGPDQAWVVAVERALGRGPSDRGRLRVSPYRHLVNARGGAPTWQTEVLVRLAWPTLLPAGSGVEGAEVVRGATVVVDAATGAVRAVIRTGGERTLDDARRQGFIAWLDARQMLHVTGGAGGALPTGLHGALHLRD